MWPFKPKETDNPHVNSLVDWLCDMSVHPELWNFRCADWGNSPITTISIDRAQLASLSDNKPGDTTISILPNGILEIGKFSFYVKTSTGNPASSTMELPTTAHQKKRIQSAWNTVFARLAIRQIVCRYETIGITDSVKQLPVLTDLDRYAGFKEKAKLENKVILVDNQRLDFAKSSDPPHEQFRADCVVDIKEGKIVKNKYGPISTNYTAPPDQDPIDRQDAPWE